MGKILSLNKIGVFLRNYFEKTSCKTEPAVADNVVQFSERVSKRTPQKVTSAQVEAYYKKYEQCTNPIQSAKSVEKPTENIAVLDKVTEQEARAYDRARFIEVSQEALDGLKRNFNQKRDKVKEIILADPDLVPREFIKGVKKVKTPEELALILRSYSEVAQNHLGIKFSDVIQKYIKTNVILLKPQQDLYREETRICTKSVELIKAVTEPTKDAEAKAIEDYLKTRYGMEYVHLENMDEAKRVLQTVMLATKHKLPLPKSIIITPFTPLKTSGACCPHSTQNFTVLLRSKKEENTINELAYGKLKSPQSKALAERLHDEDSRWFSTDDELHRYVHEFVHCRQFMDMLFTHRWEPIPKKYHPAVLNLGIYAKTTRREVDAELKTKEILRSLNKAEKELLGYLE